MIFVLKERKRERERERERRKENVWSTVRPYLRCVKDREKEMRILCGK